VQIAGVRRVPANPSAIYCNPFVQTEAWIVGEGGATAVADSLSARVHNRQNGEMYGLFYGQTKHWFVFAHEDKLTGAKQGVWFDIDGNGTLEQMSWTRRSDEVGFLAYDRNGNGQIDSGRELFGNSTLMKDDSFSATRCLISSIGTGTSFFFEGIGK
jgi:hypothetical protein